MQAVTFAWQRLPAHIHVATEGKVSAVQAHLLNPACALLSELAHRFPQAVPLPSLAAFSCGLPQTMHRSPEAAWLSVLSAAGSGTAAQTLACQCLHALVTTKQAPVTASESSTAGWSGLRAGQAALAVLRGLLLPTAPSGRGRERSRSTHLLAPEDASVQATACATLLLSLCYRGGRPLSSPSKRRKVSHWNLQSHLPKP